MSKIKKREKKEVLGSIDHNKLNVV